MVDNDIPMACLCCFCALYRDPFPSAHVFSISRSSTSRSLSLIACHAFI